LAPGALTIESPGGTAVDVARHDDVAVGVGGAALDGEHVDHVHGLRDASLARDGAPLLDNLKTSATVRRDALKLRLQPPPRGADAARRADGVAQRVARAEARERTDVGLDPIRRHIGGNLMQAQHL